MAIDAGGSHWLKYGSARQHVRSLQIVLADGQVMEVGREPVAGPQFDSQSPRGRLVTELADLILRHRQTHRTHSAAKSGESLRLSIAGRAGRPGARLAETAVRLGRDAGADYRNGGGHAAAGPASGRRAAAVRSLGKCGRGRRRNGAAGAERLRLDGSAAFEPGPRERGILRPVDSGRNRGGAAGRIRRGQRSPRSAIGCCKSSTACGERSGWRFTPCRRRTGSKWSGMAGSRKRWCRRSTG